MNSVTVTFDVAAVFPDIRILEYSGIDPNNPVDVVASGSGNSATSNTNAVTTTYASDLLVAGNDVKTNTTGPGAGFTPRMLTNPDGDIAEDRLTAVTGPYSATATVSPAGVWVMQMVAFRAAIVHPDTTPPVVSITPPTGQTGTITVTVNASDTGTGVAGVQLQIDGVPLGTAATTSPYTFSLDTTKFANGTHSLTASAWDFANNTGNASPISISFSNSSPGNPAQFGMWSGTVPLPIVSMDLVLLPNGKILMSDGQSFGRNAIVWNPTTNVTESVPPPANIFCSGMEQMAAGRILAVGGHITAHQGLAVANVFDPNTESWTVLPIMAYPRWYPTATILPDGRLIATSGETNCDGCYAPIQEIYNPSANSWILLSSAPFSFPYYPHLYLLPNGRILVAAALEAPIVSQVLDLSVPAWTAVGGSTPLEGGSSAMYLPWKIVKMGRGVNANLPTRPSFATAYVLDMTQTSPLWRQVASMAFARTYHNTTLLPDGNVLVTGGGTTTGALDVANAVLPAELWSPTTEIWTTLASMSAPRLYHSEALLVPDGRIVVSGGGRFNDDTEPTYQFSAEFFAPPYLFKGSRPTITSAPSQLLYGQNFTVQTPDAVRIARVSLIRFGSVTHQINMSQRFLPLSFLVGNGTLTITGVSGPNGPIPVDANLAPPGNYMLFLVDTSGVPSVAAVVHF
jgi:hypothetical protein